MVEGSQVTEPEKIKEEAVNFFSNLFKEDSQIRPVFSDLQFNSLSQSQQEELIEPFSQLEIDQAVASCNSSKSPGPDGFNFNFIKSSWHLLKSEFYSIIQEFWSSSKLPKGSNVAFIALIAKTENPCGFKDYRPISMVGCIYKVIAKILARRLKKVMNDLVSQNQSSFIEGRQILDSVLIAGEIIDTCKRSREKAVVLKLDFQKAFDSVSWSFLDWTLSQMGFPTKWRNWISSCVSSAAASILLNGTPTLPFKLQRGLRQGDPLSPLLFVLVGDVLNLLIDKATSQSLWSGVKVSKDGPIISHLQFADDTIMFTPQNVNHLLNIKNTLILFQLASGLKVNFHKSEILGVNINNQWLQMAARKLYCKVGSFPLSYLGLPLGGNISRLNVWEPMIERMRRKLASWKGRLLSIGGRLTLIKSAISNLPIYFMSLYPMPQGIIDKITSIQRRFLWSGDMDKRALALVKWELTQLPKNLGGLNISNLLMRNLGLLCKWLWRFSIEPNSLWRRVIQSKYKYDSSFCLTNFSQVKYGGPWKSICNHILKNQEAKEIIKSGGKIIIGDGRKTLFWHDKWINSVILKEEFPRLFLISENQSAQVASMGYWENSQWTWDLHWRRPFRPHDLQEWASLLALLNQTQLVEEKEDCVQWSHHSSGLFSVKCFYSEFMKISGPTSNTTLAKIWKGLVPLRIEIFSWLAIMEKINTRQKLFSLNILPESEALCVFCNSSIESASHLLLHCSFANHLWKW